MAVKVLELHHHGIRVGPSPAEVKKAYGFYHDVLGLTADQGRPIIPTIDGYWMDVGGTAQIHLMGVDGQSKFAQGPDKDPSRPHVALAVPDIQEAKAELDRMERLADDPLKARMLATGRLAMSGRSTIVDTSRGFLKPAPSLPSTTSRWRIRFESTERGFVVAMSSVDTASSRCLIKSHCVSQ